MIGARQFGRFPGSRIHSPNYARFRQSVEHLRTRERGFVVAHSISGEKSTPPPRQTRSPRLAQVRHSRLQVLSVFFVPLRIRGQSCFCLSRVVEGAAFSNDSNRRRHEIKFSSNLRSFNKSCRSNRHIKRFDDLARWPSPAGVFPAIPRCRRATRAIRFPLPLPAFPI